MKGFVGSRWQVLLNVSVLAILALLGLYLASRILPSTPAQTSGIKQAEEYWREQIRTQGDEAAFNEMVASVASSTLVEQHLAAHAFGGALFQQEGLRAFSICTDVYAGGCFHEFMGEAIASEGMSSIARFSASCNTLGANQWSCIHGIGHGLVGYLGYSLRGLEAALSACTSAMDGTRGMECAKGAFMEYDLRRILSASEGAAIRTFTKAERFSPCTDVSTSQRDNCYWGRSWWWYQTADSAKADTPAFFTEMGSYCAEVTDASQKMECFKGIGFSASFASALDPARTVSLCDAATVSGTLQTFCKIGAAINFIHEKKYLVPDEICSALGLSADALTMCVRAGSSRSAGSQ